MYKCIFMHNVCVCVCVWDRERETESEQMTPSTHRLYMLYVVSSQTHGRQSPSWTITLQLVLINRVRFPPAYIYEHIFRSHFWVILSPWVVPNNPHCLTSNLVKLSCSQEKAEKHEWSKGRDEDLKIYRGDSEGATGLITGEREQWADSCAHTLNAT